MQKYILIGSPLYPYTIHASAVILNSIFFYHNVLDTDLEHVSANSEHVSAIHRLLIYLV